jgi:hypothetical protein
LFHHVDDKDGRALGLQSDDQGDKGIRHHGSFIDQPAQYPIDARFEGGVGILPRSSRSTTVRRPLQTKEACIGQSLSQTPSQPGFAAAQRANDVVERPNIAELELFTAPGPGKLKGDVELRGWLQQARQLSGSRRLAADKVGPDLADFLDRTNKLANSTFETSLMRGQGRLQALSGASQGSHYLREAKTEPAKCHDLGGLGHLLRTVGSPPGRGAARSYQATLLVEPERLNGDAQPLRRFGRS